MWGRSLDREDPLEEKMATRSNGERSLVGYSPSDSATPWTVARHTPLSMGLQSQI